MSVVFADISKLTAAAAKMARAQAEFDAIGKLCGKIMMPRHVALKEAEAELQQALQQTAKDEEAGLNFDLNAELHVVIQNELDEQARAAEQLRAAQLLMAANEANGVGRQSN